MTPRLLLSTLVMFCLLASAAAVQPGWWHHSSEADFLPAQRDGTVVNSRGDILLARKTHLLLSSDDAPAIVSAVAHDDQATYVASGIDGKIHRIDAKGQVSVFAELPATIVTCLRFQGRTLLAGTGGEQAGVYTIDPAGKASALCTHEDVQYVWDLALADARTLYAATGPAGKVLRIDADGKADTVLETGELAKNILCLALEGNALYAGTDEKGLVYRIDLNTGESRVILDAQENEVAALVPDGKGGVFAATSDAAKATGQAPTGGKTGRPDNGEEPDEADQADENDEQPAPGENPNPEDESAPPTSHAPQADETPAPSPQQADEPADAPETPADSEPEDSQPASPAAEPSGDGNAVYHVDAKGFVHTIFRRPVIIHAMIPAGDRLVLATGNEGTVYYVSRDGNDRGELVDTQAQQVTCLAAVTDGSILYGTANKASVGRIAPSFVESGTLTSQPLDAGQIAQWGTIKLVGSTPEGTTLTVATRSGNVDEADDAAWSSWSAEQALSDDYLPIGTPAARFLQYRLTLATDAATSPSLGSVAVLYQVGNLAPIVSAVEVTPTNEGGEQAQPTQVFRKVAITASDPNNDKLAYTIAYRRIGRDVWVEIAEDLNEPKFAWDTRAVADGRYELRVTASDQSSNVAPQARTGSRISEPFTVDNTPPAIQDLDLAVKAGVVTVTGKAVDATSRIKALAYSVDSAETWHVVLPVDGICDSTSESVRFEIKDLDAGPHEVSVRAVDVYDNTVYASQQVSIPAAE